jgi:hypothetical protein
VSPANGYEYEGVWEDDMRGSSGETLPYHLPFSEAEDGSLIVPEYSEPGDALIKPGEGSCSFANGLRYKGGWHNGMYVFCFCSFQQLSFR